MWSPRISTFDVQRSTRRDTVLEAAKRVAEGSTTPEIEVLRLRLEKATGVPIDALAKHAAALPV